MIDLPGSGTSSGARVLRTPVGTQDGLALAVDHILPARARSHVLVVHGYGEHKERYGELTRRLLQAGHACHLFDLRGHGRSGGPRGHVPAFSRYRDDLDLIVQAVALHRGSLPFFLVAHSLGGLIALDHAITRPGVFDGLAASSPYLALALVTSPVVLRAGDLLGRILPALRIPGRLDARLLTRDPDARRAYAEDPLVLRNITPGWYVETKRAQQSVWARAGEIHLPVLFLLGGDDPVASVQRSREFFARLASRDKILKTYPGLLHEVFNETGRDVVMQDLVEWLDSRTAAGPGAGPAR